MNPGSELDILIAEKVFGVKYEEPKLNQFKPMPNPNSCPRYSTDIAAAWEVVEKLNLLSKFSLERFEDRYRIVEYAGGYDNNFTFISEAETAPHAICLAALKAVGHPIQPVEDPS